MRLHSPSFIARLKGRPGVRRGTAAAVAICALLACGVSDSVGDLQGQIAAKQSAASALKSAIAAESAKIQQTGGGIDAARARLATDQSKLDTQIAQLRQVQTSLIAARLRLVALENRLQTASAALSTNLVASYEGSQPNLMTVILQSRGFAELLENVNFMQRIGHQDAQIVGSTRAARNDVFAEAIQLGNLEERDRTLTDEILSQRNEVAAIQAALVSQQLAEIGTRSGDQSKLATVNSALSSLRAKLAAELAAIEARAAAQARETALQVNQDVGGIAIDTSGMVQPPPGAPPAVREIIAAGNAIATLPYIWGGGHASFQASGYDCSGSVSYVLDAAGLLSSPLVAADFMDWGDPGPGQWVTIYASYDHVWMDVAGWRFDTVALAEDGTRWSQGGGEFDGFVVRHPPGL